VEIAFKEAIPTTFLLLSRSKKMKPSLTGQFNHENSITYHSFDIDRGHSLFYNRQRGRNLTPPFITKFCGSLIPFIKFASQF